ncbi:MAG: gliding motility-associated C-terminal domain-containing protein [Chitinophagaceae bacterium]|nr:gliding motility-associated C-terminal domain-containing protein [Chitinophagaceae bacterium]
MPAGNFAVNINNGSDGNTLADTCFTFIAAGYNKPFVATQAPPPVIINTQVDACDPTFVKIFYNKPIRCNTVAADGTDYTITGPSPVTIVSATTDITCAAGYTNWVQLQFSAPINVSGSYVIHNGIGSDGNGIIDTCMAAQSSSETKAFNVVSKPNATFNSTVNWGCVKDTILLSHPGGFGITSWDWTFSDGSTASGQTVSPVFPVDSPSVTIRLIVSNGLCSDTATQVITLGNVFNAAYTRTPADTFCISTPVNFTDASTGNIVAYLWDFGDMTTFNGQNPPTHFYPAANDYVASLIVTDNHGCKDTASRNFHVTNTAFIDFTGLKPQYCTGNTITLMRDISRNIQSYTWDNGDGKTFQNKVIVQFSYQNQGIYTITLTGDDKYCGPSVVSKTVAIYAVPNNYLGPDTVLCQSDRLLLGPAPISGYSYTWNTGATTPQIYSDIFTRKYSLVIDNHGCKAIDTVNIKVLSACLIKVPGAFTPNGDGLNDQLKALNADLAKNFSLRVYNRLGQLVFRTNDPLAGWDGYQNGNQADPGVYVWMLSYTNPWTGKDVKEKGTSILLR